MLLTATILGILWVASVAITWSLARDQGRTDIASGEWCGWKQSNGLHEYDGTPTMVWHFEKDGS